MEQIPLFPLGTVLLPGSQLPMRLFEPRYLALLADLMAFPPERRRFGVVAIRRGHEVGEDQAGELYEIGCDGLVEDVVPVSGDRPVFNLLLTGQRRFRLLQMRPTSDKPYAVADVEWVDDSRVDEDRRVASENRLRAAHASYLRTLQAGPAELTADASLLAYDAADRSLLELRDKQRLLEAPDPVRRNDLVSEMLDRESKLIAMFHAVPDHRSPGGAALN